MERVRFAASDEYADGTNAEAPAWLASQPATKSKPSGFRITIVCLDDGEHASFTTNVGPFGLTIAATDCGRRVASVITHYKPIKSIMIHRQPSFNRHATVKAGSLPSTVNYRPPLKRGDGLLTVTERR
ncbi:MAG TPA: hypothetical protein VL357_01730 [Rariglobus sp.]|nr:hypothetical protein [Rariglobus sp.]